MLVTLKGEIGSLIRNGLRRDRGALARLLSAIENSPVDARRVVRNVYTRTGHAWKIGVTGPPGTGKSTLISALAEEIRKERKTVAVLAVDPSSHLTKGALLGDRIRMNRLNMDQGVFIRSMATRGQLGGISRAAFDASIILDAAGFDYLLVETVGAGQSDISVTGLARTVVLVMAPHLGDEIQALKAGLMEIADIYVLNKSDQAGRDNSLERIRGVLTERPSGWKPRIIRTVATTGEGVGELLPAINEHRRFVANTDSVEKAKLRAMGEMERARNHLLQTAWSASPATEARLAKLVAERKLDPYSAAERLWKRIRSHR